MNDFLVTSIWVVVQSMYAREGWEERGEGGGSCQGFHVNESFYHNGGYKTNKVTKIFKKKTS